MAPPKYKNLEHSGQTGSKSVTVCKLNSHAQSHTQTQTYTKKLIVTQTAVSAVLSWQTTVPILPLLAVQPVDTTVNLGRGDRKERHFGSDTRFPLGPKAVQLDITADPTGVEEKLEDITVHLRGDTVQ